MTAVPAPPPAPAPEAATPGCPIDAVLPDGHHPCTLPRGHDGGHDFADTVSLDEAGMFLRSARPEAATPPVAPGTVTADDIAAAQRHDYANRSQGHGWTRVSHHQLIRLLAPMAAERDQLRENVALAARLAGAEAERDKAQRAARLPAKIVSDDAYVMEAARIEMFHGDPYAATQWILNAKPDQWDDRETAWDGTETAQAWFDRARAVLEARDVPEAPEPAPGQADPGYAAYEAYAMAAPDDLEFSEWEDLPEWQQKAIYAAADAAYEARAAAVAAPLNAEIASLRAERDRYRAALHKITVDGGSLGDIAREALEGGGDAPAPSPRWTHKDCGGTVTWDHSGGWCGVCEAEGLAPLAAHPGEAG